MVLKKLRAWHANKIEEIQKIFDLSNYQILWITFFEGVLIGLVLSYFIF